MVGAELPRHETLTQGTERSSCSCEPRAGLILSGERMTVPCAICASVNSLQYQQGVASGGMAVPVGEYLGFRPKGQCTLSSGQKPQPLAGMETCVCCCVPPCPGCCRPHAVPRQQMLTCSCVEILYMAPKLSLTLSFPDPSLHLSSTTLIHTAPIGIYGDGLQETSQVLKSMGT